MRRTPILCGLLALALLGAAGRGPDAAPPIVDTERPAAGRFLIATEQIRGTIFQHSVVFLLSYSDQGALGVIVNRPTEIALHDVVEGAHTGSGMLYVGGPVDPMSVMVLVRAKVAPERAVRVADDVFMTVDAETLVDRTAEGADDLRVYAGYSGWGAGQLDGEIARGDWIVAGAPTGSIFESSPEQLWKKLHREHHRLIAMASPAIALALLCALIGMGCSAIEGARLYRDGTQALERGDAEHAVVALERAAERVPEASEVQNHLGLAYLAVGRRGEAQLAFERAVALDCENQAARHNLELLR